MVEHENSVTLGIDAGGTFTDMVLFDTDTNCVIADEKISTHHENMLITLDEGIAKIIEKVGDKEITAVNLATTFATNAIVENRLRPVRMILIGYEDDDVEKALAKNMLGTGTVSIVAGGHDFSGNELCALDETAIAQVINNLPEDIEGIAVSGYFSIRNPSHEIRASELIRSIRPDLHVTSGHELTWELNAFKRAATASLNAGLIPIIIELIEALIEMLKKHGITAPLTVVRGDGSAVGEAWAKIHPVEMLLSGPAASAVGAGFLAQQSTDEKEMWICDIGGTTTDIIKLDETGRPSVNKDGACVGSHRTLVRSIDIQTFGQGGDSHVSISAKGDISIGPLRIMPLCVLAMEYPEVLRELKMLADDPYSSEALFILPRVKRFTDDKYKLRLFAEIGDKPVAVADFIKRAGLDFVNGKYVLELSKNGYIDLAGFTPTDAFHILGSFNRWNSEAAALGALIITENKGQSAELVAGRVMRQMVNNIATEIFKKSIEKEFHPIGAPDGLMQVLKRALNTEEKLSNMIKMNLGHSLVGAGAPSGIVVGDVAKLLNTPVLQEEKAAVAGAVGAAVGTFIFSGLVLISRPGKGYLRVHHPLGITDFEELEQAVAGAEAIMRPWLEEQAKSAGVIVPNIEINRRDVHIGQKQHLWTELAFSVTER